MKKYLITTPNFTCKCHVTEFGIVEYAAPIIQWSFGHRFDRLKGWLTHKFGSSYTIEELHPEDKY
jgi:hypothetical protein